MKILLALALAGAALVAAPAAAQSLDGQTISLEITVGQSNLGTNTVVAGSGTEGNFFGNQFFRVDGNTFAIRSSSTFCGIFCGNGQVSYNLSGLDFGTPITSVTFNTLLSGVTSSFTADTATFQFTDQTLPPATYLTATFLTAAVGPVPEPATWAMMLMGFGLVGFSLRARRNGKVTTRVALA